MKAMILAAGRGLRMRPLTDTLPKPLIPVAGVPLIERHLKALAVAGFREVVINHAWLGERLVSALGDGERFGLVIRWSPEVLALETAGGIANALALLGIDPFLVINGDIVCDWDLVQAAPLAARLVQDDLLACCVLIDNPQHHPEGDFEVEGRRLTFSGIGIYQPALFATIKPGAHARLGPLLHAALAAKRMLPIYHPGLWSDVGDPQRLAALERLLVCRDGPDKTC
jgi:MurNAc alpha-1-phosphate uridylyltransferase